MHEKLGAYSGGIRAATSQFSGAGEGGPNQLAFEAAVTNDVVRVEWVVPTATDSVDFTQVIFAIPGLLVSLLDDLDLLVTPSVRASSCTALLGLELAPLWEISLNDWVP